MATQPAEPSPVPWDTAAGNRFAHYSTEDHSAPLWIAAFLSLTYVWAVLFIRVVLKWRMFGWDDFLVVISTILFSIQAILTICALKAGLGKVSESVADIEFAGELVFSGRILFVSSLYITKLSILFLLRRLFVHDQKGPALLCNIVIGFILAGGIVSILISSVQCPSTDFFAKHCDGQIVKWSMITGIDVLTETIALFLPPYMVWQLQMKVATKLHVIAAFCFRIVVVALSAVHLSVWIDYTRGRPSPIEIVPSLIWQQTLLAISLIAATVPNLKAFLQSLSASWGRAEWGYTTKAYGDGTFAMNDLALPTSRAGVKSAHSRESHPDFRTQIATSGRATGDLNSLGSGESQDLIIRKETVFTVERS